jgi:hypothetical protein
MEPSNRLLVRHNAMAHGVGQAPQHSLDMRCHRCSTGTWPIRTGCNRVCFEKSLWKKELNLGEFTPRAANTFRFSRAPYRERICICDDSGLELIRLQQSVSVISFDRLPTMHCLALDWAGQSMQWPMTTKFSRPIQLALMTQNGEK